MDVQVIIPKFIRFPWEAVEAPREYADSSDTLIDAFFQKKKLFSMSYRKKPGSEFGYDSFIRNSIAIVSTMALSRCTYFMMERRSDFKNLSDEEKDIVLDSFQIRSAGLAHFFLPSISMVEDFISYIGTGFTFTTLMNSQAVTMNDLVQAAYGSTLSNSAEFEGYRKRGLLIIKNPAIPTPGLDKAAGTLFNLLEWRYAQGFVTVFVTVRPDFPVDDPDSLAREYFFAASSAKMTVENQAKISLYNWLYDSTTKVVYPRNFRSFLNERRDSISI